MKKCLLLCSIITMLMCFCIPSLKAQTIWDGTADTTWYDGTSTSYDISTPEALAGLAILVNAGNEFNGVEINLQDDIWLNATGSTTNNWTMIGGNQTATSKETYANFFRGTFHGNGHYIYNMYCSRNNGSGGLYYQAGLFGALKNPCTIDSLILVNPITRATGGFQGALAACVASGGNVTISKVLVINGNVNENQSTTDGHNGMLIGGVYPNSSATTYFTNCGATGTVRGSYSGGLTGGAAGAIFTNCYFRGTVNCYTAWGGGGISSHEGTANNCYSNVSGGSGSVNGSSFSNIDLTNPSATLGDAFRADCLLPTNGGYPLLEFMICDDPTCGPVTGLTFSNIQGTSAELSWTASHIGTPSTYTLEYAENGTTNWQTITGITTPTYLLDNLNPSTMYQVRVYCTCTDDSTSTATMGSFTTSILCGAVTGLNVGSIQGTSAYISWTPSTIGTVSDFTLEYSEAGQENWTTITGITDNFYLLGGLDQATNYTLRVRTNCDDASQSDWATKNFQTVCLAGGDISIGNGSSTTSYLPSYSLYKYSLTYQLFSAAELGGPNTLHSISFHCANVPTPSQNIAIYLVPTTATSLSGFVNLDSTAVLVHNGAVTWVSNSWVEIPFDTTFVYDGTSNLMLVVDNNTGSWSSSNYFYYHTSTCGNSYYKYSDSDNYNPFSATSYSSNSTSNRNNVIFHGECDSVITCIAPNFIVGATTQTSVDISWVPGYQETSWEVEYKAVADTAWTSAGSVSGSTYTLSGLNANTQYYIRMRSECGSDYSVWTANKSFRTQCGAIETLPYVENFESGIISTSQSSYICCWNRLQSDNSHYAYIGSGSSNATSGSHYLDFHYTPSCYVIAIAPELDASIDVSTLMAHFWLKRTNNTSTLFEVGVMTDPADATTFVPVDTVLAPNVGSYEEITVGLSAYTGSGNYIAFRASNGNSAGFLFDDLTIDVAPMCSPVSVVEVDDITGSSAVISWAPGALGTVADYTLQYSLAGQDNWTTVSNLTSTSYLLGGLEPSTYYDVQVQSNCDNSAQGEWVGETFHTECLIGGDIAIGTGTGTNYYIPLNDFYRYSLSEQIFTAAELGSHNTFSAISFQYQYSSQMSSKGNCKIYLGHTPRTSFGSTSDYIPFDSLHLVYSGSLNCTQGWNMFTFDTAFYYNGYDNLVLVVDDNSNAYDGSSYKFYNHSTSDNKSIYFYSDSYNPDPQNPGSFSGTKGTLSNRNNVIFHGECDTTTTCVAPHMVVGTVTSTTAELTWVAGYQETAWDLEYKTSDDTTWTSDGTLSTMSETLSNLTPNTVYQVRLRANCGGDVSDWTTGSFRTECGPMTVPYSENFETGTLSNYESHGDWLTCWNRYASNTSHYVYVYTTTASYAGAKCLDFHHTPSCNTIAIMPELDPSISVNQLMATFYLQRTGSSAIFEVGVMTDPDDNTTFEPLDTIACPTVNAWEYQMFPFTQYTGSGQYIAFRASNGDGCGFRLDNLTLDYTPTCVYPTAVHVDSITHNSAQIGWTENGTATEWVIEYDTTGFTPGTGQTVTVTTNPYTLTGLTNDYTYQVYVRANCSATDVSNNSDPATFNTEICAATERCNYTFTLHDQFGDGWNGNSITVYSNGRAVSTITISSGSSATHTVALCDQSIIQFKWNSGSWASETSFEVTNPFGDQIYSCSNGSNLTGGSYFYTDTNDCTPPSCPRPLNLTVSNVMSYSADLAWTENGTATTWNVEYGPTGFAAGSGTTVVATTNPFTLTGLTSNTGYDVHVQADCGAGDVSDWSSTAHFTTLVSCPAPTSITATGMTTSQAIIGWTENGTATDWILEYGPSGFAQGSGTTVNVSTNPYTLTGLTASTNYTVYVKADCGAGDLSTTNSVNFATECESITTFPYTQGFENGGQAPACWTNSYVSGNTNWTYRAGANYSYGNVTSAHTGSYNASFSHSSGNTTKLVSPVFDLTSVSNPYVTFWHSQQSWAGDQDQLRVYYRASSTDSWTQLVSYTSNISQWQFDSLALPSPSATYQIAFEGMGDFGYGVTLDDITVDGDGGVTPPVITCDAPTNVNASNIAQTSATISWTAGGTETAWNLQYKTASATSWSASIVVSNTATYNLTGLTANTAYNVRVQADCGSGSTSDWTVANFTTLAEVPQSCDVPTGLNAFNITQTSANIQWTAGGTETAWNLQYKAASATSWSTSIAISNTPAYALTGLTANTAYNVRVQADCGSGNTSEWANANFTTLAETPEECPAPTNFHAENVTMNSVTLAWDQPNGTATEWEINYKQATAETWTNITVTTNPYSITDLIPATEYQAQILAHCTNGVNSDATEVITFTTTPDGINDYVLDNSTALYPNPTTGLVTIRNEECGIRNVNVYDVYGKLLMTVSVSGNVVTLDATTFASGIYFAQIATEKGVVTKRFVKK